MTQFIHFPKLFRTWAFLDPACVGIEGEAHVSEGLEIQIAPSCETWLKRFPVVHMCILPLETKGACQGFAVMQAVDGPTGTLREVWCVTALLALLRQEENGC